MSRKSLLTLVTLIVIVLSASCSSRQVSPTPATNMANPASVYCEQNGGRLDLRQDATGGVAGVCVFPDGSTCDEWTYYRGECGLAAQKSPTPATTVEATAKASGGSPGGTNPGSFMPPGATEEIADWWGVIRSMEPGAQYDDYFERQDLGQVIYFGIDSMDPAVKSRIEALRNSGKIVHLYGTLLSNVPDYNGSQIKVDRIEVEEQASGGYMPPGTSEEIADWWGVIKSTAPDAQYDDYFERQDLGQQFISFGIDSMDPAVKSQIEALRDSGKIVHLYGTLFSNVPDSYGSQIQVDRIEVEE